MLIRYYRSTTKFKLQPLHLKRKKQFVEQYSFKFCYGSGKTVAKASPPLPNQKKSSDYQAILPQRRKEKNLYSVLQNKSAAFRTGLIALKSRLQLLLGQRRTLVCVSLWCRSCTDTDVKPVVAATAAEGR